MFNPRRGPHRQASIALSFTLRTSTHESRPHDVLRGRDSSMGATWPRTAVVPTDSRRRNSVTFDLTSGFAPSGATNPVSMTLVATPHPKVLARHQLPVVSP